jgi:hypothetical protein
MRRTANILAITALATGLASLLGSECLGCAAARGLCCKQLQHRDPRPDDPGFR